ncbi:hypothetical protein JB92DRAFT_1032413 [Gautieria morchelliformis]|nr:hypothetical protein JB92DRAFT_1032413 [Gautieria morchelliformis]
MPLITLTASSKSSWCSYKSCRMQRGNKSDSLVKTGIYCKQAKTERQLPDIHGQAAEEKKRVDQLEVKLHTTSALEDREAQLLANMENQQNALAEAQTRSAEQTRVSNDLWQKLAMMTADCAKRNI